MRRRAGFRAWAMVWAVLQLALAPVATLADARLERDSETYGVAHVESSSTASCRPVHAAECALCQFVSRAAAPGEGTPLAIVVPSTPLPPAATRIASAATALALLPPARAPPVA